MEPIKFDKHIKDTLDKRKLEPSANAWDELSKRLDGNQEKNKREKLYWWLGIAASIVGVVFIISESINNKTQKDIIPQIVVTPEDEKSDISVIIDEDLKNLNEDIEKEMVDVNETKIEEVVKQPLNQSKSGEVVITSIKNKTRDQLKDSNIDSIQSLPKSLTFEEQKIQDIVAQAHEIKKSKNEVTDAEIEVLLIQAQKEIALEKMYNKSTGIVDANILLQDVEAEIEESFRIKVLKALKESYISVKTAVAHRND